MKKKILSAALALGMILPSVSVATAYETTITEASYKDVFVYNASANLDENTKIGTTTPTYIIYPDKAVDAAGAQECLNDLGIVDHLEEYAAKAYVVNPGEDGYTENEDENYLTMVDTLVGMSMNTKVIGIGEGADFVNEYVSQKDWMLAGVMVYGAQETGKTAKYSVPAYVSSSTEGAEKTYVDANNATQESATDGLKTYVNPENKFEKVVVSKEESMDEAFENAWKTIFSSNYRLGNIGGTFYTMKDSVERDFEYGNFYTDEKFNFTRNVVVTDLDNDGVNSLWYEYLTEDVKNAKEGTVPLVLLLHGNGNDPRTQIETSGWAEVASENNIMLVEAEWQGKTLGGYAFDPMTADDSSTEENDILTMLDQLKAKYPQIDASRIYVEGLSRGSRNSLHIGLVHPEVFAGLGVHSGGINAEFVEGLGKYATQNAEKYDMPVYMVIGTKDVFNYLPCGTSSGGASIQVALKYYQELNDLPVTESFNDKDYYGVEVENYHSVENEGSLVIQSGTLTNDKGVEISLNAIENFGHWNYEPTAKEMWNFFKKYSRNLETGEMIVETEDKPVVDETPVVDEKEPTVDEEVTEEETPAVEEETEEKESAKEPVKTGDATNVFGYSMMALLAAGAYIYTKKHN